MSSLPQTRLEGRAWYQRVALGILVVVVLAGGLFGPTGASGVAHAASSSLPPNGPSSKPVSFQGGWIQTNPIVYLVFWGPKWNTDMTHITIKNQVEATFRILAGSQYNNILRQYNHAGDTNADDFVHNDVRLMGSTIDQSTPPSALVDIGVEAGPILVGSGQIRDEATYALSTLFPNAVISPDTQVLVFPQQGVGYTFPQACGMHSYNSTSFSQPFTYAYIRYTDQGSGCDFVPDDAGTYNTSLSIARSAAWNAVHEYTEAATDPNIYASLLANTIIHGSGWNTNESIGYTPIEIADLCEGYTPQSPGSATFPDYTDIHTGIAYYLPYLWSNGDGGCVASKGEEFHSQDTTPPFTGKHTVQGAILGKYTAGGGSNFQSLLGEPLTEEVPVAGGAVTYFAGQVYGGGYPLPSSITSEAGGNGQTSGSAIYFSPATGAHEVHGYIFTEYNSSDVGGPANPNGLGFPVSDEIGVAGGAVSYFAGQLCFGVVGNNPDGSGSAIYYNGSIHTAFFVRGCVYSRYQSACGHTTQTCFQVLGLPVTSEIGLSNGGVVSYFAGQVCNGGFATLHAGSAIYYSSAGGADEVQGCIFQHYTSLGGPFSDLGYPITDELQLIGSNNNVVGYVNYFQGTGCDGVGYGQIYWSGATGAHEVNGCIDEAYIEHNTAIGQLGFPTSDEYINSCGEPESDFQHGKLVWNGTQVVLQSLNTSC